jgi:hypothetical protein
MFVSSAGTYGSAVDPPQVVDNVAAGDDQDAAVAQRCQLGPELEVIVERLRRVDRQLDDGDVGVGERVDENRPGPVIDPPAVGVEADPRGLDDLRDLLGKLRIPGRRVLHGEQFVREAVEVVDGLRLGHGRHGRRVDVPVGRHHKMARGRCETSAPKVRQASVYRLWSRAFMGLPCPNAAGMVVNVPTLQSPPPRRAQAAQGDDSVAGRVATAA